MKFTKNKRNSPPPRLLCPQTPTREHGQRNRPLKNGSSSPITAHSESKSNQQLHLHTSGDDPAAVRRAGGGGVPDGGAALQDAAAEARRASGRPAQARPPRARRRQDGRGRCPGPARFDALQHVSDQRRRERLRLRLRRRAHAHRPGALLASPPGGVPHG